MHLGALMKGLHDLKFVDDNTPDTVFGDLSLVQLVEKLRTIKSPKWTAVPLQCCCYSSNGNYYDRYENTNKVCPKCPKAHKCSPGTLVYGFGEFRLGVGESVISTTSGGVLGQHAQRLVNALEGNIVMNLEQFLFGTEAKQLSCHHM